MTRDRARRVASVLALVVIALAVAYLLAAKVRANPGAPWTYQLTLSVPLWYLVPGAIVVLRRDGHVIGWLLIISALFWAVHGSVEGSGAGLTWVPVAWRAWLFTSLANAGWALTIALLVLFPDGLAQRPARQRRTGRALITAAALIGVATMCTTPIGGDSFPDTYPNPTGLGFLPPAVADLAILPIAVLAIAAVVGLWRRARHVTGTTRRQYRWVLYAFAVMVAGLVFALAILVATGDPQEGGPAILDYVWLPFVVGVLLIPTAFCVAILRYRLYDIDRIISRTVAYALITLVVGGLYALIVVVLPEIFDLRGPLPVAAATLAAAAAFSPARRVIQQTVDRRFNRARYDARRELDAFTTRLRSEVDLDTVIGEMHALVGTTLQPRATATWLRTARSRS